MAIKYKPTKPKKEKTPKAPKEPKTLKKNKAPKSESSIVLKQGKFNKKDVSVQGAKKKSKAPIIICVALLIVLAAVVAMGAVKVMSDKKIQGEQIEQIYVSSNPEKIVYFIGEEADFSGLKIEAMRKNGETFTVYTNKCQITGFDSSVAGHKTITVIYEGYTTMFYVKVEEPPRLTPTLVRISLDTMPKTEYKVGEWLDTTGGVILCEYADGSTHRVSLINGHVYGWENVDGHGPNTYTLTVRYKENGILAETTYTINVTE